MGDEGANRLTPTAGPGIEWLAATSGTITGWLGVGTGLAAAVLAVIAGAPIWIPLGLLIALVSWMVLLRPRAGMGAEVLVLRGMGGTAVIPLAQITSVVIRQLVVVQVGERRFTNPAIGRPLREVRVRPGEVARPNPGVDHQEELIRSRVADARRTAALRAERGAEPVGPTEVVVTPAWPEFACLAVLAVSILTLALI